MEEGLVVKSLESAYVLGEKSRGLQYWVKVSVCIFACMRSRTKKGPTNDITCTHNR